VLAAYDYTCVDDGRGQQQTRTTPRETDGTIRADGYVYELVITAHTHPHVYYYGVHLSVSIMHTTHQAVRAGRARIYMSYSAASEPLLMVQSF
jgi:hypothetical protein